MNIKWAQIRKALVAFTGSLAMAIVAVGVTKAGQPFTQQDWWAVAAIVLGVGSTARLTWKVQNEPSGGKSGNS